MTAARARRPRIQDAFDPRSNALNTIRLVLATLVIFGHAAPLGGYTLPRSIWLLGGEVAVDAFFGISGFLITRSWDRRPSWPRYAWHRALRIMPAFWTCLLVTGLVVAPLATWLQQGNLRGFWLEPDGPLGYILRNMSLRMLQYGVAGGPEGIPFPGVWNGSLWSLYWEFLCYLGIGALGVLAVIKSRRSIVLGGFLAAWALTWLVSNEEPVGSVGEAQLGLQVSVRLALMFLSGAVLYLYREVVPVDGRLASAAFFLFVAGLMLMPDYRTIGGFAITYLVLFLGMTLPLRVGARNDISYGMYIYAFPTQQVLAMAGVAALGWLPFALIAVVLTIPAAAASWWLVERPALRMKNWRPRRLPNGPPPPWLTSSAAVAAFLGFALLALL